MKGRESMKIFKLGTPVHKLLTGLGLVVVLALVVYGTRQVTAAIISPEETAHADSASELGSAPNTTSTTALAGAEQSADTATDGSEPVSDATGAKEAEMIVGDPIIIPIDFEPVSDKLTFNHGVLVDLDAFVSLQEQSNEIGESAEGGSDPLAGTQADPPDDPVLGAPAQPFNAGIWAEPESAHNATVMVGVNPGPNGLVRLEVDFGDGNTLDLDDRELSELRDGGSVEIVHRYEPTLTPQRQTAVVTARDSAGDVRERTTSFTTRAQFLAGFSPLTVTALGDCDFIGKGDFILFWNIDGRDMVSDEFKLGDGDSYVEQGFRIGIDGIFHDEPRYFRVSITENDSTLSEILKFLGDLPPYDFPGAPGHFPILPGVLELGTHVVPYSTVRDLDDCDVRLDFAITFALSDRAGS
jgi:hypothetical protein